MPDVTREQIDEALKSGGLASVLLLDLLAPLFDLPPDCTGITLTVDMRASPVLDVRRALGANK